MRHSFQPGWLLLLGAVYAGACAGETVAEGTFVEAAKKLPATLEGKPLAFVPLVADAPKELKGDLSHAAWARATKLSFASNQTGQPIALPTQARIFCSNDALFIGLEFDDPDIENAKMDGQIWQRDSMELFLFPGEDVRMRLYYQVCMDPDNNIGTYYTHIFPKGQHSNLNGQWNPTLDSETVKSKKGWTAELKINFSDLKLSQGTKKKESMWRLGICRNRPQRGDFGNLQYGWSPTMDNSYHCSWRFGYIVPEAFCSDKLIQSIIERHANSLNVKPDEPASEALLQEARLLIERLGHEAYEERSRAHDRLVAMAKERKSMCRFLDDTMRSVEREHDDCEVRMRARKIVKVLRDVGSTDEDPAPPNGRPLD